MAKQFKSYRDVHSFFKHVQTERRHVLSKEAKEFLDVVQATAQKRKFMLPKTTVLWRAQLGWGTRPTWEWDEKTSKEYISGDEYCGHPEDRMRPLRDRAKEGRVNPKGVAVFYAASDLKTAISEMRPPLHALVSVATFSTLRRLKLVDCSMNPHAEQRVLTSVFYSQKEPSPAKRETYVWQELDRQFSLPVTAADDVNDYAGTQILAECFRDAGFDGLAFRSSVGPPGYCVALFDQDVVTFDHCTLHRVTAVNYEHENAEENP